MRDPIRRIEYTLHTANLEDWNTEDLDRLAIGMQLNLDREFPEVDCAVRVTDYDGFEEALIVLVGPRTPTDQYPVFPGDPEYQEVLTVIERTFDQVSELLDE